jgi:hypothetical protein
VGAWMLRCAQYDKVPEHDNGTQYRRILAALLDQALRVCYSCGEANERFDNWRDERIGADYTGTGDELGQETV